MSDKMTAEEAYRIGPALAAKFVRPKPEVELSPNGKVLMPRPRNRPKAPRGRRYRTKAQAQAARRAYWLRRQREEAKRDAALRLRCGLRIKKRRIKNPRTAAEIIAATKNDNRTKLNRFPPGEVGEPFTPRPA